MLSKLTGSRTDLMNVIALAVALVQYFGGPLPKVDETQFGLAVLAANLVMRRFTGTAPKMLNLSGQPPKE